MSIATGNYERAITQGLRDHSDWHTTGDHLSRGNMPTIVKVDLWPPNLRLQFLPGCPVIDWPTGHPPFKHERVWLSLRIDTHDEVPRFLAEVQCSRETGLGSH